MAGKISIEERVENKIQSLIKNQPIEVQREKIVSYIESLIVPKTYGTFRIYAKTIGETMNQYYQAKILTSEDLGYLQDLLDKKRKMKTMVETININYHEFFKDMELILEFDLKETMLPKLNVLMLIPFLHLQSIKEILDVKIKDIEFKSIKDRYMMHIATLDNFFIFKEYGEIFEKGFNALKKYKGEDEELFTLSKTHVTHSYKMINQQFEEQLSAYMDSHVHDNQTMLTAVKSSFKASDLSKKILMV